MTERGLRKHPGLFRHHRTGGLPLPGPDGSYGAALLSAVLSCAPDETVQGAVVAELARLVRPGGVLYVSEGPLQRDERNVTRYRGSTAPPHRTPPTAPSPPDGGPFRHHTPAHLRALLTENGCDVVAEQTGTAPTLHGHRAERLELVAQRRRSSGRALPASGTTPVRAGPCGPPGCSRTSRQGRLLGKGTAKAGRSLLTA